MKRFAYLLCVSVCAFSLYGCKDISTENVEQTSPIPDIAVTTLTESDTSTETTQAVPVGGDAEESISDTSETTSSETEVTTSVSETTTVTTSSAAETTESAVDTTVQQSSDDYSWALLLVNQTHPLPDDYSVKTAWVCTTYREYWLDERAAPYAKQMLADAKADGVNLNVISSYRTLDYQKGLFNADIEKYQKQGMTYDEAYAATALNVAIPGQSEHCAGVALDILSDEYWQTDEGFDKTKAYAWLSENAVKYGFILRYPKGKTSITGINYEPWHYRFVGPDNAAKIKASGLCLEEYLQSIDN